MHFESPEDPLFRVANLSTTIAQDVEYHIILVDLDLLGEDDFPEVLLIPVESIHGRWRGLRARLRGRAAHSGAERSASAQKRFMISLRLVVSPHPQKQSAAVKASDSTMSKFFVDRTASHQRDLQLTGSESAKERFRHISEGGAPTASRCNSSRRANSPPGIGSASGSSNGFTPGG